MKVWQFQGVAAVITYVALSLLAYMFSHPEMTQTQILLSFWAAVTWDW